MKRSCFALLATLASGIVATHLHAEPPRPAETPRPAPAQLASLEDFDYYEPPVIDLSPNDGQLATPDKPFVLFDDSYLSEESDNSGGYTTSCQQGCSTSCCKPWHLFPEFGCGWTLDGWINGGATANADPTINRYNGPIGLNDRREAQLNQLYLTFGRDIQPCNCGFDWGARADLLYGSDFFITQSPGIELNPNGTSSWNSSRFYGLAMPQAYGEVAYNRLSLKVGHFYSIRGYERVRAVDNFFYSKSYGFLYGGPFTHTGGLFTYNLNDRWTFYGGLVNGWDKTDALSDKLAVVGGLKYVPDSDRYSVVASIISGEENGTILPIQGPRTLTSLVFRYSLTDRLDYVFEQLSGWQQNAAGLGGQDAEWYNVNQYLLYTINDCWRAGMRAEWFRDDDGVRLSGNPLRNTIFNGPAVPTALTPAQAAGNYYNLAFGLNWLPSANLTVRPEIRWDWSDGTAGQPYDTFTKDSQFTTAVDAILTF